MRWLGILMAVSVLVGTWWVLDRQAPARDPIGVADLPPEAAVEGRPALDGGGNKAAARAEPAGPPPATALLVAETGSSDPDRRDVALKAIVALHAEGRLEFDWIVQWALTEASEGRPNGIVGWALGVLKEKPQRAATYLPQILESAIGARDKKQEAIARLLTVLSRATTAGPLLRAEHMPVLLRLFQHEASDYWIKRTLVDVLGSSGAVAIPLAEPIAQFLKELLANRVLHAKEAMDEGILVSWDHVEYDIEILLGGMGPQVVPVLVRLLGEMYDRGAMAAAGFLEDPTGILAGALVQAGEPGIRALIVLSRDPRGRVRNDVAWALSDVKEPNEVVQGALLAMLQDEGARIRARCAESLAVHGAASIPDLLRLLKDEDTDVRKAAAKSLGKLGVKADDALAPLLRMLESSDWRQVAAAAQTISTFGAEAVPVLPHLLALLASKQERLRDYLVDAAILIVPHWPHAVADAWRAGPGTNQKRGLISLLTRLDQADPKGERPPMDADLKALIPTALDSEDLQVRVLAARHLAAGSDARILEILRAGFLSEDGPVRILATEGLAVVGAAAASLLPTMIARLRKGDLYHPQIWSRRADHDERFVLGDAIADLGRHDPRTVFELLGHETWDLGYAAREAFARMGTAGFAWLGAAWPRARTAQKLAALETVSSPFFRKGPGLEALREAARALARHGLEDADPSVRFEAVKSLRKDDKAAPVVLPVLIGLLDLSDLVLVKRAARKLGSYGAKAAPVRAEIEIRSRNANKAVARTLRKLLEVIDAAR